ncbi:2-iminobutanoate/2-iminopropanoate deaminase [Buchnera aphidicola (Eriosoma lanigerum)]|uniref:RidA family protein n=1 Tax=Buchnera aphidicola TaxID=9 RepID=UPI003463A96E
MFHNIYTKNAPEPIGPYSQAIQINNYLITSGQIPIDAQSNQIPEDIIKQTYLTLSNIKSILLSSNFEVKNIIKTTIYIVNMEDIDKINTVYKKFFLENNTTYFPARSCIEVQSLPKKVKIEIEAIAYKHD